MDVKEYRISKVSEDNARLLPHPHYVRHTLSYDEYNQGNSFNTPYFRSISSGPESSP